ncbi:MAG: patatin-like phospholipase family protein, partial [Kovacikia sp.]
DWLFKFDFLKYIKPLKRLSSSLASNQKDEGLFDRSFENFFVNLALLIFSILSLPLIRASTGTLGSWGLWMVLLLLIALNGVLLTWQKTSWRFLFLFGVTFFLAAVLGANLPATWLPDFLGPISVIAISLSIFVVILATIYNWGLSQNPQFPIITILVGLAILSSFFNFNDNHRFRQFRNPEKPDLPSLESSFEQWLANRPDRAQFSNKPYPVYIATAQGGGIYAAYHAATAFTKLTEYFPSFPQHVFAISGVSGGSLGASAFSSLVKAGGIRGQSLSQTASQLFSYDLLSPLLTMGLFPDLIQRFIFFPIYDWDRATGLEVAFENDWDKLSFPNQENPLRQSFYQHWQPQGNVPALVLNTTIVETGDRLAISPFKIILPNRENIALDEPGLDLKLSTAAGLSARFPYFTPVGWYQRSRDHSKLRLADGGYFDNSGIPTALDIGRNLQKLKGYGETFEIIYLSLIDQHFNGSATPIENAGLNELLSPINALFSARESRSRSAVELSTFTVNDGIDDPLKYKFRTLFLKKLDNGVNLPLGWFLSDVSRKFIDSQTPNPKDKPCDGAKFRQSYENGQVGIDDNHNRCVITSIGNDLS